MDNVIHKTQEDSHWRRFYNAESVRRQCNTETPEVSQLLKIYSKSLEKTTNNKLHCSVESRGVCLVPAIPKRNQRIERIKTFENYNFGLLQKLEISHKIIIFMDQIRI